MLYDPARHEALAGTPWHADRARAAVREIVQDIEASRLPAGHWPVHPLDEDGPAPRDGFKSLYLGSAGLWWALWWLAREGAVDLRCDPAGAIDDSVAAYRAGPDTGEVVPSYLLGEAGLRLVQWRLTGASAAADRLHEVVQANIGNPTNESLWAAPGTMVAAWHLWQATAEARWRTLFLDNVEQLWCSWQHDPAAGGHVWTQDMYGRITQYLGAGHGFAGNVYPLLTGAALLDADRRAQLHERTVALLCATAQVEDGAANWAPGLHAPRPGATPWLVQWCHGAPGVVTAVADLPSGASTELDALLVAGGETVWRAGPLAKGYGLCHGTAGNGYAFLKLHRRTGDAVWLARARAFAMHSLGQRERLRQQHGQGRYTLWTGDAGLAVYLWQCLSGDDRMAGLDVV